MDRLSRRIIRTCGLALALTAGATGFAAATPDDLATRGHWPTALVFEGTPPRAQPRPGSACEVADQYVRYINTDQAPKVPALFTADGEFIGVDNHHIYRGPADIATFYNTVHQGGAIPLSFIDQGDNCIMELAGQRPADPPGQGLVYKLVAIDHFTATPDHRIKRLVIFFRLGAPTSPP